MAEFRTIDDLEVAGKRALVRADLNVPMKDGAITDTTRIERTAPTIVELAEKGARVIVLSHLGRPNGEAVAGMSLGPVVAALGAALGGRRVTFADASVGPKAEKVVAAMTDGDIALLENLRFDEREEMNDAGFAAALASLGDVYVGDAFSCAHRAHASTEALARLLPAVAGRLMQAELEALHKALDAPDRPLAALVGGAKVSTKLDVLTNLVRKVDQLILGGGMANTFLGAAGVGIGASLAEADMAETARTIMRDAAATGVEIVLPDDAVVASALEEGVAIRTVPIAEVPRDAMILDIGAASSDALIRRFGGLKTLVWNGPLGAFEVPPFDAGTNAVARAAADLTKAGRLISVAGGGDTVAALSHAGVEDGFSYVSAAGGAFLEWLEGRELPGVAVLKPRS
ncbi:MAG: phosphoglycerate kinase [Rhodospirillales bacterium]|jgi:phosphoglycerate kinase|nr:phosphoglycerate kinase [Rhodospirillales bacterium]MDP6806086.1 phosphoglycerate kinase [Rhodospirillales bacterium]